jgi:hypothetical protein
MKPIHKFNNGRGATTCNQCSVIITTGLTDDLYCKECKDHRKKLLIEIMKEDEDLGLYIEQMEKEELKQETLEEASHNAWLTYEHVEGNLYSTSFKNGFKLGAKWEQEQDKNKYSEEDIKIMYRSLWVGNCFDFDTSYEMETNFEHDFNLWFEQFKKK